MIYTDQYLFTSIQYLPLFNFWYLISACQQLLRNEAWSQMFSFPALLKP